ncbi:tRNA (guanine-N(7)-)-methyltransferase subunit TRM82 [Termitomyces sp. J132]|nr:tRNA (guanine-N(7)-)-methyltransferase subunit TRM82 [Termitomyces sp. J132]
MVKILSIYSFAPLTEKQKKDALSSHENPSGGSLILGHTSLLYAFLLSQDEKYIITADRDEHIRVSWYPQGYNIEMYCLGHTKFVSAIHNPAFAPAELVSGGGDPMLKIWDWMTGLVKHEIPVWETVEPYIRIRSSKRKRGADSEDGSEVRRKGRGKKAKGKGKAKAEAEADDVVETPVIETSENALASNTGDSVGVEDKVEKVLVIHKIETTASRNIIFSAVGGTALFSVAYPGNGAPAVIRALELGQPVLDFVVAPQDNRIWVTLDGNWSDGTEPRTKCFVLAIEISESGEVQPSYTHVFLTRTLNSTALLPATEDDLKRLELYNDLVAMPKGFEVENDPEGDTAPPEPEKQSKRILGRLKNKQKVLDKERELAVAVDDEVKEPDAKKTKSDVGGQQDVDMAEAQ